MIERPSDDGKLKIEQIKDDDRGKKHKKPKGKKGRLKDLDDDEHLTHEQRELSKALVHHKHKVHHLHKNATRLVDLGNVLDTETSTKTGTARRLKLFHMRPFTKETLEWQVVDKWLREEHQSHMRRCLPAYQKALEEHNTA